MKISKLILTSIFTILFVNSGYSQRGISVEEFAKQETKTLSNSITDLTEIQYERIYNINLKYTKKILEHKRNRKSSRNRANKLREIIKREKNNDIKMILTKEQYIKYLEFQLNQENKRRK